MLIVLKKKSFSSRKYQKVAKKDIQSSAAIVKELKPRSGLYDRRKLQQIIFPGE